MSTKTGNTIRKPAPAEEHAGKVASVTQMPGTAPAKAKRKSPIDLERLEIDYRVAKLTVRECASAHGISPGRVVQIAKQYGWERDRAAATVRARASVLMARETLNRENAAKREMNDAKHARLADEPLPAEALTAVDAVARSIVTVRSRHRETIHAFRSVAERMLQEIIATTDRPDLAREIAAALEPADENESSEQARERQRKVMEMVHRVVSTPGRAKTMRDLTEIISKLIALERQAHDIDDKPDEPPPIAPDRSMTPRETYQWLSQQRPH